MTTMTVGEALAILDNDHAWRKYQVHYPPATSLSGKLRLRNFNIARDDIFRAMTVRREGFDRDTGWGQGFTALDYLDEHGDWQVWMSDTRAEVMEHSPLFNKLFWSELQPDVRVLINGLGLGVAARAALSHPNVSRVDVVEVDPEVVELVSPLIKDERLAVHIADAHTKEWKPGTRWDLVWHDIWPTISEKNVPSMQRLHRRYARRCDWQDSWQRRGHLDDRDWFKDFKRLSQKRDLTSAERRRFEQLIAQVMG